jgi:hypothetical protein
LALAFALWVSGWPARTQPPELENKNEKERKRHSIIQDRVTYPNHQASPTVRRAPKT